MRVLALIVLYSEIFGGSANWKSLSSCSEFRRVRWFFGNVDLDFSKALLQPLIQIKCYEFQIGNNRLELIDPREIIIFAFDSNNRHRSGALASDFYLIG